MDFVGMGSKRKETQPLAWPRRTEHGSTAWTAARGMLQPQDGASPARASVTDIGTGRERRNAGGAATVAAMEPEDARITGGTRSLMRRLLGLNIGARREAPKGRTVGSVTTPGSPQVA